MRLTKWVRNLFGHDHAAEAARERVERDQARIEHTVERLEQGTEELERRVYEVNNITEAIAQMWRSAR